MVTFVPATSEGVAVAVPPFATGKSPVTPVVSGSALPPVRTMDDGVPRAVPDTMAFAVMRPEPDVARLQPVPQTMVAEVFVPFVIALKAEEPPPQEDIQEATDPFVLRQSPDIPLCEGRSALIAADAVC
jgi:hypothetical protein